MGLEIDNQWDFTAKVEVVNNDGRKDTCLLAQVTLENDGLVRLSREKKLH